MTRPHRRLKRPYRIALRLLITIGLITLVVNGVRSRIDKAAQQQAVRTATTAKQKKVTEKTVNAKPTLTKQAVKTKLLNQWQQTLDNVSVPVTIAVAAKQPAVTVTLDNSPTTVHTTASILKVAMLMQLLHQHQENGTQLTDSQRQAAEAALDRSDNDAADTLYFAIGGATGLNQLFSALGMTHSNATSAGWVLTTTTAPDQLKLLAELFEPSEYLSKTAQAYIKDLMSHVISEQNWGISAGASRTWLKNGWRLNPNNTWMVNSIGRMGSGKNGSTLSGVGEIQRQECRPFLK